MEIAIVDNLLKDRAILRNLANKYFEDRKDLYDISPNFTEFESGEAFLEHYTSYKYEIVFLDIYMNKLTGMDVAKKIAALDRNCSIIFFTTSDEHQLEGYDVHAIGYIMKPVKDHISTLYRAMDYATNRLQMDKAGIKVVAECGEVYLYYRNILYIDCIDRTVYIHLADRVFKVLGKYRDYQNKFLPDNRFLECYRNVIVNMDYIDIPLDCDFILKSGEKLPISRRKKTNVMEKYMMYFIKKRG
ncbi:LytR/AlgR family response regulator transcription factor [Haloimpatiens sp. FM7315]|uniref:LytR/AlgR family response regulator transcription factor n=1 Tax=Haloimpatiens sp. FM7315 TaxID=3298609 RepID=UPI00370AA651